MPGDWGLITLLFGLLCVSPSVPNCLRLKKGGQFNRLSRDECSRRLLPLLYVFCVGDSLCALLKDGGLCSRLQNEHFCSIISDNITRCYKSGMQTTALLDLAAACPTSCLVDTVARLLQLKLCPTVQVGEVQSTKNDIEFVHLKSPPAIVEFFLQTTTAASKSPTSASPTLTTSAGTTPPATTTTTAAGTESSSPSKGGGISVVGLGVGIGGVLLIIGMIVIVLITTIRQRKLRKMHKKNQKEEEIEEDKEMAAIITMLSVSAHSVGAGGSMQVVAHVNVPEKSDHAIPIEDVDQLDQVEFIPPPLSFNELQEELLGGQFGITELLRESVHLGDPKLKAYSGSMLHLAGIPLNSNFCRASYEGSDFDVRALSVEATEEERLAFLQEAFIQAQFSHPTVVQLVGVVTVDDPLLMVLEYMANNTLSLYLQEHGSRLPSRLHPAFPPGTSSLFAMAHDIASAMTYLESKNFIHGALTSSSTFVMNNGMCKVGNFGASLKHYTREENDPPLKLVDLAVRWCAPEVLENSDFSTASDVWSYGVILYELWTSGAKPYEYWSNIKVSGQVKNGHRLSCPPSCPCAVHHVMLSCWNMDPLNRPSFHQLLSCLPSVATDCTDLTTHR